MVSLCCVRVYYPHGLGPSETNNRDERRCEKVGQQDMFFYVHTPAHTDFCVCKAINAMCRAAQPLCGAQSEANSLFCALRSNERDRELRC
jgi:hypothetical protein